jgi:hypothetical protein
LGFIVLKREVKSPTEPCLVGCQRQGEHSFCSATVDEMLVDETLVDANQVII